MWTLWQDLRYNARLLLKHPGFTLTAVGVLTLGIGVNAGIFGLINGLLFRPLSGASAPGEVVGLFSKDRTTERGYRAFSYPGFEDVRSAGGPFAKVAAHNVALGGVTENNNTRQTLVDIITTGYFETMGIALVRGRYFADTDAANAPLVAIVDDQLAQRWWQRADAAIGQRVRVGSGTRTQVRTIVGVVHRVSHNGPGDTPLPALYAPQAQIYQRGMYTVIETSAPPATVFAAARAALAAVDPAVPLYFAETSDRRYDDVVALPRFIAGLVSGFSTIALVLAGVGIFGVTGYAVSQRRREFGIRLALGAQRSGIGGLVIRRVALLVGVGIVAGIGVAMALGSTIGSLLFGVQPDDPATFVFAAVALGLTALLATVVPVRAAVRVDPAVTLKAE